MGFTVRFMLGTVLVLLCSWSIQTAHLYRPVRQVSNNGDKATDKLQKIEVENSTQNIVANLNEEGSNKPKTDFSTEDNKTIDKQNSIDKLQKSEPYKKAATQPEIGRSIDIEKYVSKDFHNKNNVYTLPTSPDTEKYIEPDYDYHSTTHKHVDHSEGFDFHAELTTPKSSIFDHKYKEAVKSVDQKLEHIDDSHEVSSESESKENINLEKLYDETKKNDTTADLNYINYKNIISNDTGSKNTLHKDLVVEAGTNLDFRSSYNHTTVIDEDDSGNNTIVKEPDDEKKAEASTLSNIIPAKGDLDSAESSTSKSIILTTRKSNVITKPPSNKNSSHISILSNNIETETVKAINPIQSNLLATTEKPKGEAESASEFVPKKTSIDVAKRMFMFVDATTTEPPVNTNEVNKKSEQLLQENQVIPVHVEPPPTIKNNTVESSTIEEMSETTETYPKTGTSIEKEENQIRLTTLKTETTTKNEEIATTETATKIEENVATETLTRITTETILNTESTKEVLSTTNEPATPERETDSPESRTEPKSAETEVKPTISYEVVTTISASKPQTKTILPTETEEVTTNVSKVTETETVTSVVTETSISPWEKVTTEAIEFETKTFSSTKYDNPTTFVPETHTIASEPETTMFASTYQADSTAATTVVTTDNPVTVVTTLGEIATTDRPSPTTETLFNKSPDSSLGVTVTTENTVRTSKEMSFKESTIQLASATTPEVTTEITITEPESTTVPQLVTTESAVEITIYDTTQVTNKKPETTTSAVVAVTNHTQIVPEVRQINHTDSGGEESTTENNTITSEYYEHTDAPEDNSGTIAAITISSIGAVCLILLAGLLVIMRKRQKRFNYGQRCTPVSLDDYSMDSVYNSVRRKVVARGSKRSYGNPAFEDPVSVSHPLNFPALGKFANNLEDIKAEFEEIPQITARTNELPEGCDTKNRYANVIPLPETRVFLTLIDGYPNSDYINANYVSGPKNTKGYYIACQAPMQNTVDDFWRMIWEQQSKVILMTTHLFENGVEKCVDYLPPSEVLDCHRLFGDFQVTLKKREVKDKYIISSLQLKNMVSNSWREVTHFWYMGWPEKGVPIEANSLIAFLIEARSYMKSASLDRKDVTNGNLNLMNGMPKNELNPVVVHCSPGTGRTGVVIACDIAIREFEQTRLVDVPRIVYKIRRDRASAVQTKEQYAFIYKVINLYATKLTGGALDSL